MAKSKKITKTLDEVLEPKEDDQIEMNAEHLNDWHTCTSGAPFKNYLTKVKEPKGNFNFQAAITSPKSIRFRQRDCDFEPGGKKGDYLFVDQNNGRTAIPYKLFKLLFA